MIKKLMSYIIYLQRAGSLSSWRRPPAPAGSRAWTRGTLCPSGPAPPGTPWSPACGQLLWSSGSPTGRSRWSRTCRRRSPPCCRTRGSPGSARGSRGARWRGRGCSSSLWPATCAAGSTRRWRRRRRPDCWKSARSRSPRLCARSCEMWLCACGAWFHCGGEIRCSLLQGRESTQAWLAKNLAGEETVKKWVGGVSATWTGTGCWMNDEEWQVFFC